VLDFTHDLGGPAALLCDPVMNDGEKLGDGDAFSSPTVDLTPIAASSPILFKWTQECEKNKTVLDFIDRENLSDDPVIAERLKTFGDDHNTKLYWVEQEV
jgi:hypothetical protein